MVTRRTSYLYLFAAILILCGIGTGIWYFFVLENDDVKIRKVFKILAEGIRKSGNEGLITALGESKSIAKTMGDNVSFGIREAWAEGTYERDELMSRIYTTRKMFDTLSIDFYDFDIQIVTETKALIYFNALLNGKLSGGTSIREARQLVAEMHKNEDDEWRFVRFDVEKIVSGP